MKLPLDQIKASPTPLRYREASEAFDARLHEGAGATEDFAFPEGLEADLEHYRAGLDVVFGGRLSGDAEGRCARCLERYRFAVDQPLHVVLVPRAAGGDGAADEDWGLGFFEGEDIDLTALVVEHAILGLPTIPLCHEGCRGLCPQCGINRNVRSCTCEVETRPRLRGLAALAGLKVTDRGGR